MDYDRPMPPGWGASQAEWEWYCYQQKHLMEEDTPEAREGRRILAVIKAGVPPLAGDRVVGRKWGRKPAVAPARPRVQAPKAPAVFSAAAAEERRREIARWADESKAKARARALAAVEE